ncbi:MAG: aminoacyl-histidine dipeptidase [Culturomica sp.]|jgi:dipeptidase D|nr:aminoacyl-histidine dipeptidase [Culturomica sp.]
MILTGLKPEKLWQYFEEICQIPRPSKNEEKMTAYLLEFAAKHNLEAKRDEIGNVLIKKVAVAGMENAPTVVLQAHTDMVGEKNADTVHDFERDPIVPYIDGEWVKARGTTLGADDGIGVAAQLAILASKDIKHGDLECLFTVDEETGLSGAFALKSDFFDGRLLLNLDSEDEGEIFIGCAGGIDTLINQRVERNTTVPVDTFVVRIVVSDLQGGHSGDDINKGRGNAIKILNRFLWQMNKKYGLRLVEFNGGNLRNAIAREASAVVIFDNSYKENVRADFNVYSAEMEEVWNFTEPNLKLEIESTELVAGVKPLTVVSTTKLLEAIYACPHGVVAMSMRMPGMVETSTNLASVRMNANNMDVVITTSQRSDLSSEKMNVASTVECVFKLAGAEVQHSDGYPGWVPNPNSKILKIAVESYKTLFGKEPIVRSIHAGLECGLFSEKFSGIDMISFGPTLRGVHSPNEKVNIKTVEMWWKHLLDILQRLAK